MFEVISLTNHLPKELYFQKVAWTSLDPDLYSSGSSSATSAAIEISNSDFAYHTPGTRMMCSTFHTIRAIVTQVGALWTGLQTCGD